MLKQHGRAAMVVPDYVLFEAAPARPCGANYSLFRSFRLRFAHGTVDCESPLQHFIQHLQLLRDWPAGHFPPERALAIEDLLQGCDHRASEMNCR
jgi:hypothetical protein